MDRTTEPSSKYGELDVSIHWAAQIRFDSSIIRWTHLASLIGHYLFIDLYPVAALGAVASIAPDD